MSRKVIISEIAEKKLESLLEYLLEEWSFKVKTAFIKKLDKNIQIIKDQPDSFPESDKEIGNLNDSTPLRVFFHRINFRKGRVSAISATARKLSVIIWNMVVKGVPYINPEGYLFLDQKRKLGLVKCIKKQIDKFSLTNEDIGFEIT